jgi:hypothetical protein
MGEDRGKHQKIKFISDQKRNFAGSVGVINVEQLRQYQLFNLSQA